MQPITAGTIISHSYPTILASLEKSVTAHVKLKGVETGWGFFATQWQDKAEASYIKVKIRL